MIGLRSSTRVAKRAFASIAAHPIQLPQAGPLFSLPQHQIVDEEKWPGYKENAKHFYPARPGEILGNQFQLLTKLGWGVGSTVWLARNMRAEGDQEETVTLKILNNGSRSKNERQRALEEQITQQNLSHRGWYSIRPCYGHFEIPSSEQDPHLCLIYEPQRETMLRFQDHFTGRKIPLPIAKAYITCLLLGVEYLHAECRVIHTDLKLENIMMTFENEEVLPRFIKRAVIDTPMSYKNDPTTGRILYRCHNNFGSLYPDDAQNIMPKITDFGAAKMLPECHPDDKSKIGEVLLDPIQPNYYRSPEVILGYGWNYSTDIWNFGVLLWNIIEGAELFTQVEHPNSDYNSASHLAEMIALLGPPPKEVIERSNYFSQHDFDYPISLEPGRSCKNIRELFCGPHFDEEGEFLHKQLVPNRKLEDTVPSLKGEEKELFLSFARDMLTWVPAERKSARELIEHPFLSFGGRDHRHYI
ncbi:hypothetical protein N7522_010428 [Penicillium canescens]|uniref:Protein kinase domain-containing protein n=1 Tax=Penicillium canescens TaxID=5083 RepID=A0AAD6IIX1_PENCN|nr:uncharacterized protein N7446_006016 [Penicillium canescens]KAJ5990221.1 hypothetical protein N7522_010428 [Penicillium canescens]KAJ6051384.1 hypothetical protein N7460_001918 [Penicillium canescens]KAJ6061896.1 hypothetical protein N7446_006016 [Penicillium canescens]KAJ6065146.1 hypothetical protein N7444_000799 [Penicillium canescens]KAJ6183083.1 hypothetical protein N7485_001725 [Penicillium canescens]